LILSTQRLSLIKYGENEIVMGQNLDEKIMETRANKLTRNDPHLRNLKNYKTRDIHIENVLICNKLFFSIA